MNMKQLQERKAELFEAMNLETRSETFNTEKFEALKEQFEEVVQAIADLLALYTQEAPTKKDSAEAQTEGEITDMKKEVRSLLATGNTEVLTQEVFEGLVQTIDMDADLLQVIDTVTNNGESLTFVVEDATQMEAAAVAEKIAVEEVEPILKGIKVVPTRKGAYLQVSKEFLSAIGNTSYEAHVQELLVDAVKRKLKVDAVKTIKANTDVEKVETLATGVIGIDDVIELILSAPQGEYVLLGKSSVIRSLKKMKDANGHLYVQNGQVNGKLTSTFMGVEMIEHSAMDDATTGKIALALVGKGAVKQVIGEDIEITPVFGENVKQGIKVFNIDILHDVKIVQEDAVKLLTVK